MSAATAAGLAEAAAAREDMVRAMCAAVDAGDAPAFAAWFGPESTYRFGNGEVLVGSEAVEAATADAAGALPWVRHDVDQVAQVGDQLFCRFTINTAAPDGAVVALPCVTVIRMDGEVVADYRVHMDIAPATGR